MIAEKALNVAAWLGSGTAKRRLESVAQYKRAAKVGGIVGQLLDGAKLLPGDGPGSKPRAATEQERALLVERRLNMLERVEKIPGARFVPFEGRRVNRARREKNALKRAGLSFRQIKKKRREIRPLVEMLQRTGLGNNPQALEALGKAIADEQEKAAA